MSSNTLPLALNLLDHALALGGRSKHFTRETALLGALPEMDSMAVVALITAIEDQLEIEIPDEEIDGDTFTTVGSFTDFLASKIP